MTFQAHFKALTGHTPFDWQIRLFERFAKGKQLPEVCSIPTGLGKTSVIPIWLTALAQAGAEGAEVRLPRRLIYIVNRRTVVDQATDLVEGMLERLKNDTELHGLSKALQNLAASEGSPLAVSTLRGELADNQEWKADPARPAVIIGTIDMIGSKLLFSGYGDSRVGRAHHAGLIGQDTLIVHDEAHLTPPFSNLLKAVRDEQEKSGDMWPIHVMELSATPATANGKDTFSLLNGEAQPEIRQRLEARKTLRFHSAGNDKIEDQIAKQALEYEGHNAKVLIYVQKPELAQSIEKKLTEKLKTNAIQRVALLTGTIRGYERDELVKKEIYQAFLKTETKLDRTVYLVSTSAGEVGVDWDADHLVCDLMPLDSMIQRLGRVNRRGGKESFIDCVVGLGKEKKGADEGFESARQETIKILENLPKCGADGYDASPQALTQLLESLSEDERRQAFSPQPDTAPVTDILLDAWSLTSVNQSLPGRPEVAEFLHGLIPAYDRLETYVAWRDEVRLLHSEAINEEALSEWFQRCRLETRERLRDRPERVFKQLEILSANSLNGSIPVILLNNRGEFERRLSLTKLVEEAKTDRQKSFLYYRTVILPADAGGLTEHGMLDAKAKIAKIDVAEAGGDRTRVILMRRGNEYRHTSLRSGKSQEISEETRTPESETDSQEWCVCDSYREAAAMAAKDCGMTVSYILPLQEAAEEEEETTASYLVLLETRGRAAIDQSERMGMANPPTVEEHNRHVMEQIGKITRALGLPDNLHDALRTAADYHDRGKAWLVWQRAIHNVNGVPLAKSGSQGMNSRWLGGFRHEFASLVEAGEDNQIISHAERDLILHVIAAHHGRARPHFDADAFDPSHHATLANEDIAYQAMRRFARLQQRYGRWGLAWLEALLRCADIAASQAETEGRYTAKEGVRRDE